MPQTLVPCRLTNERGLLPTDTVYRGVDGVRITVWRGAVRPYGACRQDDALAPVGADTVPRALAQLGYCLGPRQLEFDF